MRVLLDECIPRKLKTYLDGHTCVTVQEAGWAGKRNGELLRWAQGEFDVFVTLDKGVEYQQNLAGRKIAVLIMKAPTNRLADLVPLVPQCLAALGTLRPGQLRVLVADDQEPSN